MRKKFTVLIGAAVMLAMLAGCSKKADAPAADAQSSAQESAQSAEQTDAAPSPEESGEETAEPLTDDWKWERKVTLVCPWGVGGGADGTLRPIQPVLQDILGVPVEIVNVEGAGGANGIDFTCKQPADGYTYVLATQSHIMLDLQKILPVDLRTELQPVAKLVHSINILASSRKGMEGKYTNFTEFVEYAKNHPQELSCAMLSATGADSVSLKQTLAGGLGCDITEVEQYVKIVNYSGGSEQSSAIVGGHVNIMITGADEIMGLIESGDIVPLISMSENRMSILPELECTGELGIDSYVGTWRGILCRTGTPEAAVRAMAAALEEAWNSDEYQNFLETACYLDRPGYAESGEFRALMDEEYVTFEDYLIGAGLLN